MRCLFLLGSSVCGAQGLVRRLAVLMRWSDKRAIDYACFCANFTAFLPLPVRRVTTNFLETVRADSERRRRIEAGSRELRDAQSPSASSVFVRLCPSTSSGRTDLYSDSGIDKNHLSSGRTDLFTDSGIELIPRYSRHVWPKRSVNVTALLGPQVPAG